MTPARMDSLVLSVHGQLGHQQLPETAARTVQRLGPDLSDSGVVILGDLAHALHGEAVSATAFMWHTTLTWRPKHAPTPWAGPEPPLSRPGRPTRSEILHITCKSSRPEETQAPNAGSGQGGADRPSVGWSPRPPTSGTPPNHL